MFWTGFVLGFATGLIGGWALVIGLSQLLDDDPIPDEARPHRRD